MQRAVTGRSHLPAISHNFVIIYSYTALRFLKIYCIGQRNANNLFKNLKTIAADTESTVKFMYITKFKVPVHVVRLSF